MTTHRMDQETVERLLVGPGADAQDVPEVLLRLLAAVRVAARPHELGGEAAALQAFRTARAGLLPAAPRPGQGFVASLLSAKIALAALLAAATGGVALAAATDTLPAPISGGAETTATPKAGAGLPGSPTTGPGASPTPAAAPSPTAGPTGQPSTSARLTGLCRAYLVKAAEQRRRVLETPSFADLVSTAGGRDKVTGYCERLLDALDKKKGASNGTKERTDSPPTGPATGQPAGGPATTAATPAVTGPPAIRPAGPSVHLSAPVRPTLR
ncbi:hypothetical protein [Micromonospora sp. NPDC047738]|uniref:hypothetical protein n=1 Tax=unclassified Micromonospora TaxID=2617518 RepID=UPI0033F3E29D